MTLIQLYDLLLSPFLLLTWMDLTIKERHPEAGDSTERRSEPELDTRIVLESVSMILSAPVKPYCVI